MRISFSPVSIFKMRLLKHFAPLCLFILNLAILANAQNTDAPSDSPQDGVNSQSSYLGGSHNISPSDLSNFTQLWNATFNPDEKVLILILLHLPHSTNTP
jgi:hypothetical protein